MWIDVIQQRRSFDISSQQKTRPPLMMIKKRNFLGVVSVGQKTIATF
jgi:hypothetical protein